MNKYAKAIVGAGVGFLVAFLSALLPYLDGGFGEVEASGWVTATIAGLVSLGAVGGVVYAVPNSTSSVNQSSGPPN